MTYISRDEIKAIITLLKNLLIVNGGGSGGTANLGISTIASAEDYIQSITYLDAGTTDERVSFIEHSSISLGKTLYQVFTYAGSPGSYRISNIQTTDVSPV